MGLTRCKVFERVVKEKPFNHVEGISKDDVLWVQRFRMCGGGRVV